MISALVLACSTALSNPAPPAISDDPAARLALRRTPIVTVFENTRDAVVNIASTQIVEMRSPWAFDGMFDELFDFAPRRTRRYEQTSVGSGFVIHPDGYVVTNAHVVARTVERKAIFADGGSFDADIVAIDMERDLAVLKIEGDKPFRTIKLGRSDDLMIGETAIAIGNPLGLEHTLTVGVVSALNRKLEVRGQVAYDGLVQTDTSINPGNSGGPLLNILGELIGINSAIRGDAQNIGFAIPVDHLREALPSMLDVERRYQFVTGMAVSVGDDATVTRVDPGSPAAAAGVRVGDRLLRVGDRGVSSGIDFSIDLIGRKAGEQVALKLGRGGQPVDASLALAQRPEPDARALASTRFGIRIDELSADESARLGLRRRAVVVADVARGSSAAAAGIERSDILLALGQAEVNSVRDLGAMLEELKSGEIVRIVLLRPREGAKYGGPIRVQ